MKRILPFFLLASLFTMEARAQFTRYVVKLKNKGGSPYSFTTPLSYLSQRAIDRRTRYTIALDSTDLPVTPAYVTQIDNIPNVTILNVSKWLNAVSIQTSDPNAITAINALPFVQGTAPVAARPADDPLAGKFGQETVSGRPAAQQRIDGIAADYFNYGNNSFNEIHLHNGEFLHNIGLRGQGMQIAMLDNGFNNYTTLKSFDSINLNGQVLGTWDFVAREQNVANDGSHGMSCLSTIAANIPGQFIGKAPKASFWLYQTEDNASEYPIEEFNWACGAERADSTGADILSSSLGYGYDFDGGVPDYPYSTLNGNTTMSAIAADLAVKKGILVFVAAGNAGNLPWHFIITPADGDSVLAVGAVNTSGIVGGFSSYGPSGDGQIKPDIASVGVSAMIQNTDNTIIFSNGTSFACPNMAGLGTCLRQGFPEFNNMKIAKALQLSGSIASAPNDRIGYGIPNVKNAFAGLLIEFATSSATVNGCNASVSWTSKDINAMKYEIERKVPGEAVFSKVGEVTPAPGALLANHNYTFTNTIVSAAGGTVSYRIRQIIDTAAATFMAVYIDTAVVNISSGCFATGTPPNPATEMEKIWVQPNPVSGPVATLVVETPYAVNNMPVAVYDGKGRLVMQWQSSKNSGRKTIDLAIGRLAKGKYYIKVLNGHKLIGTVEWLRL